MLDSLQRSADVWVMLNSCSGDLAGAGDNISIWTRLAGHVGAIADALLVLRPAMILIGCLESRRSTCAG